MSKKTAKQPIAIAMPETEETKQATPAVPPPKARTKPERTIDPEPERRKLLKRFALGAEVDSSLAVGPCCGNWRTTSN